jgi:hypothetical protein
VGDERDGTGTDGVSTTDGPSEPSPSTADDPGDHAGPPASGWGPPRAPAPATAPTAPAAPGAPAIGAPTTDPTAQAPGTEPTTSGNATPAEPGPLDRPGPASAEATAASGPGTTTATIPPPPGPGVPPAPGYGWAPQTTWGTTTWSGAPPPGPHPPGHWPAPAAPRAVRPPRPPRAADPAPRQLLLVAVVGGIAFDIGLRGGLANAMVLAAVAVTVLALVTKARIPQRSARLLATSALVPAAFLAVRTSPWLTAANTTASALLVALAIVFGRSGSLFDTSPGRALQRLGAALPLAWSAPMSVVPALPRMSEGNAKRAGRIGTAAFVAVPILGLVVALLAAADPVFAGLITPDIDAAPAFGHVLLAVTAALAVLAVVGAAAAEPAEERKPGTFGTLEVVTMLALTAVVLGLFVVSQLVALTDAGDRLVRSSGLTPAEYARTGFFQLCWATGILLAFLGVVRALAAPEVFGSRLVRGLSGVVPLLALGLAGGSLRRMALYDQAFGLTMLRLTVVGVTVWMGIVLILFAARNLGLGADRGWVLGGAVAAALVLVLVADVANPEAFVVRHDVRRAEQGVHLDGDYLATLSDDAAPALAEARRDPGSLGDEAVAALGLALDECRSPEGGVAAWNLSAWRAERARERSCPAATSD